MQLLEEYIVSYGKGDDRIITFPTESFLIICKADEFSNKSSGYEIIKIEVVNNQEGQPAYFKIYIYHPIKNGLTQNYVVNQSHFWNLHSLFWSKIVSWEEWPEFLSSFLANKRKVIVEPLDLKMAFIKIFFFMAEKFIVENITSSIIVNFSSLFVETEGLKYIIREFESLLECSTQTHLPSILHQFNNFYFLNSGPPSWIRKAFI